MFVQLSSLLNQVFAKSPFWVCRVTHIVRVTLLTSADLTAALSTGIATMSSLAQLQVKE